LFSDNAAIKIFHLGLRPKQRCRKQRAERKRYGEFGGYFHRPEE
jgi:hypothetical protein